MFCDHFESLQLMSRFIFPLVLFPRLFRARTKRICYISYFGFLGVGEPDLSVSGFVIFNYLNLLCVVVNQIYPSLDLLYFIIWIIWICYISYFGFLGVGKPDLSVFGCVIFNFLDLLYFILQVFRGCKPDL